MSANSYIDQMKALSIDDEKKNMREKYKPDMQVCIRRKSGMLTRRLSRSR